jgi:hypothetical protein
MSKNPLRKMDTAALYAQLGRLIESMPNLLQKLPFNKTTYMSLGPTELMWLGRAEALVAEALGLAGELEFKTINQNSAQYRDWWAAEIPKILYRALAQVEMELPAPSTGAFIPAGNAFDALKAVQRIFSLAKTDVLVVDPYLDDKILTEFALFVQETLTIRLLADASAVKATLFPSLRSWKKQYGSGRPVTAKLAPARSLHDRLIIIDSMRIWTVGQSFRDLAVRAPTSFVEADSETAALKIAAYGAIWETASSTGNS